MANAFLDTSALVKYYHPEDGTPEVTRIVDESGSRQYISRLSLVETVSAFAVKFRIGQIDEQELNELRRRFYYDIGQGRFRIMPVTTSRYQEATQLIERHVRSRLRTLDALQLAVA
jgi:predicted nucleic acid-binding protein